MIKQFIEPSSNLAYRVSGLLLSFLVTVVMSVISYEAFEKFFLRMKDRFATIKSRPV